VKKLPFENVLVLAPHTDDGELGAGGAISRLIAQGANVYYAAFSTAEESVPEGYPKDILKTEVRAATAELGIRPENLLIYSYQVRKLNYVRQDILEELIRIRKEIKIDLVLQPSLSDVHQDHYTVAMEGLRAFKTKTILGYELIWNNISFNTECFIELEPEHVEAKVRALSKYESQRFRDYTSSKFIYALAHSRGVQVGKSYAEAFEVVRQVL
jgi:N-acetylglucosamine malate deacetylase 1